MVMQSASSRGQSGVVVAWSLSGGVLLLLAGALLAWLLAGRAQASPPMAAGLTGPGSPGLGSWVLVPPVTGEDLRDVDMVSSNLGWAVGENGTVLRYNGTAWQPVDISSTLTLVDV